MSIAATATTQLTFKSFDERRYRRIKIAVTGLANGANTIPHGLVEPGTSIGATPKEAQYVPTSAVVGHETQAADATNLYFTVDSGAGTTLTIYVTV